MKRETAARFIQSYWQYIVFFVLFIAVSYALLYLTYENVKWEMIENLNDKQMILAKQTARGIETFFNDRVAMLQRLARNDHIIDLDETGKQTMRDFHAVHAGETSIITRVDREGRIAHPEPYDPRVIGQPVAVPEAFEEVKRTHDIAVSDVFMNHRGFKTIILHVPIRKNGAFDGTIGLLFPFDYIARRYIDDIRVGRDGYAWMISRSGVELSCPVPGHVGSSVFDNCRDFPDILAMARKMMRGEQGVTTYQYDRIRGSVATRATKHAVYMPIRLGNNFWSIVIATPEDELMAPLRGFRNSLLLIGAILMLSMGLLLTMLFRSRVLVNEIKRRQKVEEELRNKTAELDNYFTSSLDLLCIADADGYFRRLNPEWEKTLGYPLSELEGKSFLDFVHPDDVEATRAASAQLEDAQEVVNFVNRYRHKDRSYRWIEWRSYPAGKMIYAVARDITERRKAEEELRESEAKLQSLFRAAPIGIGIVVDRVFTTVNQRFCRMLGYPEDELPGQSSRVIYPSVEEFRAVDHALSEQIRRGGRGTVQTRWKRTDGQIIDILLSSSPMDVTDWSRGIMFTALDITEHKRLEDQLQHAQKMDAIGTLAGGIAHDFNNLLMSIQGNASLMLIQTDPGDPRYDRLRAIEEQIMTGAALTRQILGFARGSRYEMKAIDMNEIVEQSLTLFGRTKKELSIHEKHERDLWTVEADRSQMEQVIMNLLINAWQAMPEGGHLYLETANRAVTENDPTHPDLKPGRYVKIAVTDTGVGMDEQTRERIFEPFFTTKEKGRGTGLGLAVVYGIVKGHKGHIDVSSEKGAGTTFTIHLPASGKKAAKTGRTEAATLKGRETILLVDDEEAIIDVMEAMLKHLGYEVLTARNGKDAIRIYEKEGKKINLVILDMIMPGMSGGETFTRLREMNHDLRVILSSGYSLEGESAEAMARDCNGFIQKPVNMADLSQKIREVLAE